MKKRYPCIPLKQGDYSMVVTAIPAKELFELVKINRREDDRKKGYQRALSESRTEAIGKYIDSGNAIPTNIVVALDKARVIKDTVLEIDASGDAGWVIDGQHRLGGASEASGEIELPVTAFLDLNDDQKIAQFVTINKEAKKVPTSLYLDLLPDLRLIKKNEGELAKERAVDIANQVNENSNGPFYNKIASLKSPEKGQLSLTNFVRKVSTLVHRSSGYLKLRSEKEQRLIIESYFKGLKLAFPSEFSHRDCIFFKTVGFGGIMNALELIYEHTLKRTAGRRFKPEDVAETLKGVARFEFSRWRNLGTGNAAENAAGSMLTAAITESLIERGLNDTLEF